MKIPTGRHVVTSLKVLTLGALTTAMLGCGRTDSASFVINGDYTGFSLGADTALTFEREKAYAWSDWEVAVVVRHDPDCQRRHHLLKTGNNALDIDMYVPARGVYILKVGRQWYVTELKSCRLQTFKEPPPAPGSFIGSFEGNNERLKFVPIDDHARIR